MPDVAFNEIQNDGSRAGAALSPNIPAPVTMETGDGWIVVSRFRLDRPAVPPYAFDYSYTHYAHESDADEHYRNLLDGEYGRWEAVCMTPCKAGIPLGAKVIL